MGILPPVMDASAKVQQSDRSLTPVDLPDPSAAPHSDYSEVGRHRSTRSVVNQEVKVEGPELHDYCMHKYDWQKRQALLKKAIARRAEGALTDEEVYMLNWFLVGDCKCFREKGRWWCETPGARFEEFGNVSVIRSLQLTWQHRPFINTFALSWIRCKRQETEA